MTTLTKLITRTSQIQETPVTPKTTKQIIPVYLGIIYIHWSKPKDKIFKTVTETKCTTYRQIKRKIIEDFFIYEWICCQIGTVENIDTTENSFRQL